MISETFRPVTSGMNLNDSYTDVMLLREGSMSRLYRVSKAGKYFIIKTTKDNTAMQLSMLKREYELSIKLQHYHLSHVYTYEEQSPVGPGIVMEYIDGRDLNEYLTENPDIDSRRRVFAQLLEVVSYIHKNGIIHNDLKPENILISRANDDVKLLDFGLSNSDAHYLTKSMGGTREYASPELLAQSEDIDARSDIYSLGHILRKMFPHNYRGCARKCLCVKREDRWVNVDQLYRNFRRSGHPVFGLIIVILIGAVLGVSYLLNDGGINEEQQRELLDSLSIARDAMVKAQKDAAEAKQEATIAQQQFDSIRDVQAKTEAERQQWEETKNLAVNEMKKQLNGCYQLASDSIEKAPYMSFAYQILKNYTIKAQEIKNKYIASAADETIGSIIASTFETSNSEYSNALNNKAKSKPNMYDKIDELGVKKIEFYNSLLQKGLPFREYEE